MSRLLTRKEFTQTMKEARLKREENPSLHMGQSFYNALPPDIAEDILKTKQDMFHEKDDGKAKSMLFELVDWEDVDTL